MEKYFWKLTPVFIIDDKEFPFYDAQVKTQSRSAYDQMAHAMHSAFCLGAMLPNIVVNKGKVDNDADFVIKKLLVIRVEKYQSNTWAVYIDDKKFSPSFETEEAARVIEAQQKALCDGDQNIEVRHEDLLISVEDIH